MNPFRVRRFGTPARWLALGAAFALVAPTTIARAEEEKTTSEQKQPEAKPAPPAPPGARPAPSRAPRGAAVPRVGASTDAPLVFTNEDLDAMYGGSPAPESQPPEPAAVAEPATAAPPVEKGAAADPLELLQQQKEAGAQKAREVAAAEVELASARDEVAALEKQVLAIKNPFAARPELSDEEKERRASGESTADRLNRAEQRLADARTRVGKAEQDLARTRSGSR